MGGGGKGGRDFVPVSAFSLLYCLPLYVVSGFNDVVVVNGEVRH